MLFSGLTCITELTCKSVVHFLNVLNTQILIINSERGGGAKFLTSDLQKILFLSLRYVLCINPEFWCCLFPSVTMCTCKIAGFNWSVNVLAGKCIQQLFYITS